MLLKRDKTRLDYLGQKSDPSNDAISTGTSKIRQQKAIFVFPKVSFVSNQKGAPIARNLNATKILAQGSVY